MFFCFSSGVVTPPLTYKPSTINFLQKKWKCLHNSELISNFASILWRAIA